VSALLDKLGIAEGSRVALLGVRDPGFLEELEGAAAVITDDDVPAGSGLVLLQAETAADLDVLSDVRELMARDGAVWVLWPKGGVAGFNENDVRRAGLATGLVDVKVVSFSERLSGLKFVLRVAHR
jgi:hypothetical protein